MRTIVPALFLAVVLGFLVPAVPAALKRRLSREPKRLFALPAILTFVFCLLVWSAGALSLPFAVVILAYTLVPTVCIFLQGPDAGPATWLDLGVILLLWLPVEFNMGGASIPRHAQGFVHTVAYGIALTLALVLFLGFRGLKGTKYNLPARIMDFIDPLIAFVIVAPVLIVLGRLLGFIPPFHVPDNLSGPLVARTFGLIFVATALPEEILFRSLMQNWLMEKFGSTTPVLVAASIIFGCAHLNNASGPLPNWRYMILATIAGFAYGKVFQRASSAIASMTLHAMVDAAKHLFF